LKVDREILYFTYFSKILLRKISKLRSIARICQFDIYEKFTSKYTSAILKYKEVNHIKLTQYVLVLPIFARCIILYSSIIFYAVRFYSAHLIFTSERHTVFIPIVRHSPLVRQSLIGRPPNLEGAILLEKLCVICIYCIYVKERFCTFLFAIL